MYQPEEIIESEKVIEPSSKCFCDSRKSAPVIEKPDSQI